MWSAGILNIAPTYPKGFSGFTGVRPLDWCVDERSSEEFRDITYFTAFRMTIVNGEGSPIKLLSVETKGQCKSYDKDDDTIAGAYGFGTSQPFVNPDNVRVAYVPNGKPLGSETGEVHFKCSDIKLGDPYKFQVIIEYNKTLDKKTSVIHKSVGYIWGTFESNCPSV